MSTTDGNEKVGVVKGQVIKCVDEATELADKLIYKYSKVLDCINNIPQIEGDDRVEGTPTLDLKVNVLKEYINNIIKLFETKLQAGSVDKESYIGIARDRVVYESVLDIEKSEKQSIDSALRISAPQFIRSRTQVRGTADDMEELESMENQLRESEVMSPDDLLDDILMMNQTTDHIPKGDQNDDGETSTEGEEQLDITSPRLQLSGTRKSVRADVELEEMNEAAREAEFQESNRRAMFEAVQAEEFNALPDEVELIDADKRMVVDTSGINRLEEDLMRRFGKTKHAQSKRQHTIHQKDQLGLQALESVRSKATRKETPKRNQLETGKNKKTEEPKQGKKQARDDDSEIDSDLV